MVLLPYPRSPSTKEGQMDWKSGYPMGQGACYDSALPHCPDVLCSCSESLF